MSATFGSPKLWITLISTSAVLYFALGDLGRTSPGPLAAVHGRDPKLTGWNSCNQCHGGWFSDMAESCLECHQTIREHMEAKVGLHGRFPADKAKQCARCHSDHHGEKFVMVNQASFAKAGIAKVKDFKHERIGFAMAGRHLELECTKCHTHANVDVLPEGARRYIGLTKNCAACHEDAHEGRMRVGCATCHGQVKFDELHAAGHDRHLPLTGGHAKAACRDCHAKGSKHSLEALGGGRRVAPRQCADCHESPHRKDFIAGVARLQKVAAGASCAACHKPLHTSFVGDHVQVTPAQHACSGFALAKPHDEVDCESCHVREQSTFAARYPGRGPDSCQACHDDPHRGQFATGPFAAKGCVGCHERTHFAPHAFTVQKHARTGLPLTGRHVETDCSKCHKDPREGEPRRFRGTASECKKCHGDAHAGFFAQEIAKLAKIRHGECAHCHVATSFGDRKQPFDHHRWAKFAVKGAHAQSECESCHKRSPRKDEFGRTFGRVASVFGPYRGCVTCHEDPHKGRFDGPKRPRVVKGRTDCARCHVETSFRAFPNGFDHALWTGFPLSGAHRKADCTSCHEPLDAPDAAGRTFKPAKGRRCTDCHSSPHGTQFDRGGRTTCERCHQSTNSFKELVFKHDIHSRFKLGKAHRSVKCSACHKVEGKGAKARVRYRPMRTACVACHAAHDDPFKRRKVKRR